jgi:DNA helicase HerA-like ATPase
LIGELLLAPSVPATLDAGGFDRHTFLCGQSGSGKTYSLGLVLERLLMETDLRLVILDPNSDYVRLGEQRSDADAELAAGYAEAAKGVVVRRPGDGLQLRLDQLDPNARAAALALDPVADREEFALVDQFLGEGITFEELATSAEPHARALRLRAENLGVANWQLWARGKPGSFVDDLERRDARCLVVDLGSLATREEQAVAAEAVLATLWRRRADREPVLIVIDEAHNVCPQKPDDPVTALVTEHAVRIAAEGRKFGLYLLVSTQRPQKVHENVLSQCDNLLVMRMNSLADLGFVADVFSFVPSSLLERATAFRQGEALVAGKISSHPSFVRFGARVAEEGGSDIPADWARPQG